MTTKQFVLKQIARQKAQVNRRALPAYKQHHLPQLFKTKRTPESTPQVFERENYSRPDLQLISTLHLYPTPTQIAQENVHPKYPLNEKEKKKPHLMKKREAVFRDPQSVNHTSFNNQPDKHDYKNDPNGKLTLRDALLVNMLADDVQSEIFNSLITDERLLYPKIGMPYDRVPAQSPEMQATTTDTINAAFEILEKNNYINATEHGDVLSVNLTAGWTPSLSKAELSELDESVRPKLQYELWEHSFIHGNWLRPHIPQVGAPTIQFPADTATLRSDKHYSVVLVTPDFPYRLYSEPGVFVHWWVSNLPGTSNAQTWNQLIESGKANTIIDYLAPLPCEYGGTGRYFIMIFEQDGLLNNEVDLKQFKEQSLGEKYKNSERYLNHLKVSSKFMHWYEKEALQQSINSKLELFDFDPSKFNAAEVGDSEYRLQQTQECGSGVIQNYNNRRQLSLNKMFGKLPHGLCYAKIEYEYSVTEYLQEKGMGALEREYVPPDVVWERSIRDNKLNKRQETYINNRQWL